MSTLLEDEVVGLRRRVRDLEEELGEYRRRERPLDDIAQAARVLKVRDLLFPKIRQRQPAAIVLALMERPGAVVSKETLMAMVTNDWEEKSPKIVDVMVCYARRGLRGHGIAIHTVWGIGYSMSVANCDRVKVLIGELADARAR